MKTEKEIEGAMNQLYGILDQGNEEVRDIVEALGWVLGRHTIVDDVIKDYQ